MARKGNKNEQSISKNMALIELKNHILQTLHKLSNRDTQQLAMEELEQIVQDLTPEGIALFLACLHDTDAQYKSVVRRDCVRLVGILATIHGNLLACHLPKIVGNIIRRLKDPDSIIRKACIETIGVLASEIRGVNPQSTTNVFVKPLLEALIEKHENLQMGASMCLAQVIKCTKDPHILTLQRLCPQILKMLASPNFLAKASLLNTIGIIVQIPGVISLSQLSILLSFAQEELNNSEWIMRKAAADILSSMATIASTSLGFYRESVLIALENSRFDKVKQVRDSVCQALQLWKSIYTHRLHGTMPSKIYKSRSPTRNFDEDSNLPSNDLKNISLMKFGISMNSSICNTSERLKSMLNKHATRLKKKQLIQSNKMTNPKFFCMVEGEKDSIDWQVGITPQDHTPHGGSPTICRVVSDNPTFEHDPHHQRSPRLCTLACEEPICHNDCTIGLPKPNLLCKDSCETFCPNETNTEDFHYDQKEVGESNQSSEPKDNGGIANDEYQDQRSSEPLDFAIKWKDPQTHEHCEYIGQLDSNFTSINDVDKATIDMVSIHQHFQNLERQQLSLMEMLQESMVHVQESLQSLEERVSRLEHHPTGDTAQNSSAGRSTLDESHSLQRCHAQEHYLPNDFLEERESEDFAAIPSSPRTQNSLENSTCGGDSDEFTFIRNGHHSLMAETAMSKSSHQEFLGGEEFETLREEEDSTLPEEDFLTDQAAEQAAEQATRVRDQGRQHGLLRNPAQQVGCSNSTRSVWHASEAEAIAAIRGAATPRNGNPHRNWKLHQQQQHSLGSSRDFSTENQKRRHRHVVPFWMLWSRAMENVQNRDFDEAYSDILGSKDELLLVRLMSYTGPVWEHLGEATVSQLLASVKQFLRQQSFLDCVVPWIQQVIDLVSRQGPQALALTGETLKDLVWALQNAAGMDYTKSLMGAKIAELAGELQILIM